MALAQTCSLLPQSLTMPCNSWAEMLIQLAMAEEYNAVHVLGSSRIDMHACRPGIPRQCLPKLAMAARPRLKFTCLELKSGCSNRLGSSGGLRIPGWHSCNAFSHQCVSAGSPGSLQVCMHVRIACKAAKVGAGQQRLACGA